MYASKSISVQADMESTWQAIEGLDEYPQWNPLLVELRPVGGDLQAGRKVQTTLRLGDKKQQRMSGAVADYRRGARLRLALTSLIFCATADWRVEAGRPHGGASHAPVDTKVTLSFAYESRVPFIASFIDELALRGLSDQPVEACLQRLKARVEGAGQTDIPSNATAAAQYSDRTS